MGDITIPDLDDDVLRRLERRAAENGRSAEDEVRLLLTRTFFAEPRKPADDFWERAAEIRERLKGTWKGDCTQLIRESRDER